MKVSVLARMVLPQRCLYRYGIPLFLRHFRRKITPPVLLDTQGLSRIRLTLFDACLTVSNVTPASLLTET